MATASELHDEVQDYYLSWDGKGTNPRPYDPADCDQRSRGRAFRERQSKREQIMANFERIKSKNDARKENKS